MAKSRSGPGQGLHCGSPRGDPALSYERAQPSRRASRQQVGLVRPPPALLPTLWISRVCMKNINRTSSADRPSSGRPALLRISDIVAPDGPLPISRSAWWAGVSAGRFPKPVKLGPRITAWRADDIRALLDGVE